jgi:gluconokinase
LGTRHGHYMNPGLLRSQFDALEAPAEAISIDVSGEVSEIVSAIRAGIGV